MTSIFISYRREDSKHITGRIGDRLVATFGEGAIFKDVDSIPIGINFADYIDEHVSKCDVLLAVIGRDWLNATGKEGTRRLDSPRDFVRTEIESALKRDIPVVPVLIAGAEVPDQKMLPASIRELAMRSAVSVRADPDFHRDMDRLIEGLEDHLRPTVDPISPIPEINWRKVVLPALRGIVLGAVAGGVVGLAAWAAARTGERNVPPGDVPIMISSWVIAGAIVGMASMTAVSKLAVTLTFAGFAAGALWAYINPDHFTFGVGILQLVGYGSVGAPIGALVGAVAAWVMSRRRQHEAPIV